MPTLWGVWEYGIYPFAEIHEHDRGQVGGKGAALAVMVKSGMAVPAGLCLSVGAYQEYVSRTGLREKILMEVYRKSFEEMRWQEIWDTTPRIRNLFLHAPIPDRWKRG